jgi:hypothetical protein
MLVFKPINDAVYHIVYDRSPTKTGCQSLTYNTRSNKRVHGTIYNLNGQL